MMTTIQTKVVEICDNGDAIIQIPDEILDKLGWREGDELNIEQEDNGIIFLTKKGKPTNMYNDVVKFIEACDQERNASNANLYVDLIEEEYDEFLRANYNIEELDACMDMIWVILGYCYMCGFDVEGAWAEVARSNLAKIDPVTGKVNKRSDGKVLKPEGWTPPELGDYVSKD